MKTPSLDDMKLAVAKMLPDEIIYDENPLWFWWKEDVDSGIENSQITDREWQEVCFLAEGELTFTESRKYKQALKEADTWAPHYSVKEKLTALCRVKRPEMFTESTI